MPFPPPDHPHYCHGSHTVPPDFDPDLIWQRCPRCRRPVVARRDGRLFAHLDHPTRRNDAVQETLIAHGANRREEAGPERYADDRGAGDA